MKIQKFKDEESWMSARRGKITGTRLKDIVVLRGTNKKIGYYEVIAERLGLSADDEPPMERGKRLEEEAVIKFTEDTGKKVNTDLVLWTRDDNQSIALSPDGYIGNKEAVEVKCLSSARHIEAYLTNSVPKDFEMQVLQYFIVNDELETLHFVFYDPRLLAKPYFHLEVKRKEVKEDVEKYLEYQRNELKEIDKVVLELSNF